MTSPDFVPVTDEIVKQFYGEIPPVTIRAVAAVQDGRVLGIAGVYKIGMAYALFSDLTDEFVANKRNLVIGLREVRKIMDRLHMPVYAKPETENTTLIEHAGVTVWPG